MRTNGCYVTVKPMRFASRNAIALFLFLAPCAGATAQQRSQPTDVVRFRAVSDLAYSTTGPALLGARRANPQDFPATFYGASSVGRCTSTLVGPRVLLTAAHCVHNGGSVTLERRGVIYRAVCEHAPEWPANETADWALCLVDRIMHATYETINTDPKLVDVGTQLLLTGFGCTQSDGTGGNDGIYRIGESRVTTTPDGADYDIITTGGAALCFGDSGGPAFLSLAAGSKKRLQVAVNSSGDKKTRSNLPSLSTAAARQFIRDWSDRNAAQICGVHIDTPHCR